MFYDFVLILFVLLLVIVFLNIFFIIIFYINYVLLYFEINVIINFWYLFLNVLKSDFINRRNDYLMEIYVIIFFLLKYSLYRIFNLRIGY